MFPIHFHRHHVKVLWKTLDFFAIMLAVKPKRLHCFPQAGHALNIKWVSKLQYSPSVGDGLVSSTISTACANSERRVEESNPNRQPRRSTVLRTASITGWTLSAKLARARGIEP